MYLPKMVPEKASHMRTQMVGTESLSASTQQEEASIDENFNVVILALFAL